MTGRRGVWLPVVALVALTGVLGAVQGARVAQGGETAAIRSTVERYLAEAGPGATEADCAARPGQGMMGWLVVTCRGGKEEVGYRVNRLGWISRASAATASPET